MPPKVPPYPAFYSNALIDDSFTDTNGSEKTTNDTADFRLSFDAVQELQLAIGMLHSPTDIRRCHLCLKNICL